MKIFVKVAELGSFSRAAEGLQIGRPQVTLAIKDLEATIGVRLFQRTTRHVSLTTDGNTFLASVQGILKGVAEATSMFANSASVLNGRLRIDIPSAFAQTGVIASIRQFMLAHPGIEVILGVTDRNVDMVAEGVDCVVRLGELKDSSSISRRIGGAVMVTCASPQYFKEFGEPHSVGDLKAHRSVNFLSGSSGRVLPWQFLEGERLISFTPKTSILVNDSHAYVECGVAGFGLLQVPGFFVKSELRDGRLKEVLHRLRPPSRPVSVIFPSKKFLAPQVRVFANWIQKYFIDIDTIWLV